MVITPSPLLKKEAGWVEHPGQIWIGTIAVSGLIFGRRQQAEIAGLRKEVKQLKLDLAQLARSKPPNAVARQPTSAKLTPQTAALKAHREALGLSAKDYGLLLGVSGLTVYNWEKGAVPRARMEETIAAVSKLGKRAALAKLEKLR